MRTLGLRPEDVVMCCSKSFSTWLYGAACLIVFVRRFLGVDATEERT